MSIPAGNSPGGGIGPLLMLDGATSTGAGRRVELKYPCSHFGLQVVGPSTSAQVLLRGAIASSSDAPVTTLLTWDGAAGTTSGTTVWSTQAVASQLEVVLDAGSSSDGASAWVSAVP